MTLLEEFQTAVLEEAEEHGSYAGWEDVLDSLDIKYSEFEMVNQSRWAVIYQSVAEYKGKFFRITHSRGATEYQENGELVDEVRDVYEVEPYTVTVTKYRKVTSE